jgi:hypothetical protein
MITSVAAVSTSQIPQGWDLQELLAALQASWWCTMLCRLARIVVRPYAGIKSAFDKSASSAASTSVKAGESVTVWQRHSLQQVVPHQQPQVLLHAVSCMMHGGFAAVAVKGGRHFLPQGHQC